MKKIFYLAVLVTAVFTACQKDTLAPEEPLNSVPQNTIKPLEASDEMLSFNSEEEMYAEIDRLMMSNDASSNTKTTHSGFASINDVYKQALADLDIVEESKSFELAAQVKEKYQPYLLYNDDPADNEMYNPYVKTDIGLSYVCNKNGDVIINGEVKNFNTADSVKDTESYKLKNMVKTRSTHTYVVNGVKVEESTNHLFMERLGERRFWAFPMQPLGNDNGKVHLQMSAAKDTWLGWYSYTTRFYVKYETQGYGWDLPHTTGVLKWCSESPDVFIDMGEHNGHNVHLGTIFVSPWGLNTADIHIRMKTRGTAGVSGVLKIIKGVMPK